VPPALPRVPAGQDGFAIQSANGDFRLQIGLLVHSDGRFALDDSGQQIVDTFAFRRLRPYWRGRFSRRFEFYFNPDFAGGTPPSRRTAISAFRFWETSAAASSAILPAS
jgi:hypothetical protein